MESIAIPKSVARMEQIKSMGLDGVNRQAILGISAIVDKDKNLNQLVSSYNKSNRQNEIHVNKPSVNKITRDVEIEL